MIESYSRFTFPITPEVREEAKRIEKIRQINSSGNRFIMREKDYIGAIGELALGNFLRNLGITFGQPEWRAIGFVDYWIGELASNRVDVKTALATKQTNEETFGIYINQSVWQKAQEEGEEIDIYVGALIDAEKRFCLLTGIIEGDRLKKLLEKAWRLKMDKNWNTRGVGIYEITNPSKTYFRIAKEHMRDIIDLKRFDT